MKQVQGRMRTANALAGDVLHRMASVFRVWVLSLLLIPAWSQANPSFLDPEKAFVLSAQMVGPQEVEVRFNIARGYYMYRERFEFALDDPVVKLGAPVYPNGVVKYDATFNKDMELYFGQVAIRIPIDPWPRDTPAKPFTLNVTSQGCAEAGLCYPPMESKVNLSVSADGTSYQLAQGTGGAGGGLMQRMQEGGWKDILFGSDDTGLADLLTNTGIGQVSLLFFLLGVLLALTPCVLPMVPILSVLLVGEQHHVSRWRGLALAASYVLGMSLIYTALGVAAGLSGAGLAAWLQTPMVIGVFALMLGLLALAMFDVYQLQMPSFIQSRLMATNSTILGGRMTAGFVMGALSALIVGPCVAAPLAGALLYISQTGDVWLGGSALFSMAWGMGLPLLVMGASAGKLLPKTGPWMEGVKKFFGVLLFATAWWMANPILPTWVQILGWAVLAMFCSVLMRTFDPLPPEHGFGSVLRKTIGMLLALLSLVWVIAVASGGRSLLQPLHHLNLSIASTTQVLPGQSSFRQPDAVSPQERGTPSDVASSPSGARQSLLGGPTNVTATPVFNTIRSVSELDAVLAQSSKPVMLDFYADWCVSCKEMEAFTFTDPGVRTRMSNMILLKADVTANNQDDRALLKRFRLFGPPGIIFFEPGGRERKDVRVVGFQDAARFRGSLDKVLTR